MACVHSARRVSYYSMGVDGAPPRKQKSSGVNVFTGTGSTSWAYNIDQLPETTVAQVLNIGARFPLLASLHICTFTSGHLVLLMGLRDEYINRTYMRHTVLVQNCTRTCKRIRTSSGTYLNQLPIALIQISVIRAFG